MSVASIFTRLVWMCYHQEPLEIGKDKYIWLVCANKFRSAVFDNAIIIYFFTKRVTLMRKSNGISLPFQPGFFALTIIFKVGVLYYAINVMSLSIHFILRYLYLWHNLKHFHKYPTKTFSKLFGSNNAFSTQLIPVNAPHHNFHQLLSRNFV